VLAVAAVLRLLCDIVAGREVESEREERVSDDGRAHESSDSGGCGCGSGSLEARTAVAHHVVEFLFEQATSGAVGRPEMEAFVAVRRLMDLPRAAFDALVEGLSSAHTQRRVATPRTLRRLVDGVARPMADILMRALLDREPDAALRSQATDAIAFVWLAHRLLTAREACVEEETCLIPLADLSMFGLRDADLVAWWRDKTAENVVDDRCARLMEHARAQALAPLAAAIHLIDVLPGAQARAVTAYLGLWAQALLSEPIGRREPRPHMDIRLKSHRFRAWRFAISRRFDPRVLSALVDADPTCPSTAALPAT